MINDETKRKLRELNMSEIITGLEIQQSEPDTLAWSFDDRIQRLVDYVYQEKYNSKISLLVIDEWLVSDMSDSELYFLFELFERRSDTTSTIFCTQYRQEDWVTRLNESVQAEAIVDRYAHTSFWIEMGSMNMREYCAKHKI